MSLSGITVNQDIVQKYESMRLGDGARLVLKIDDERIVVEEEGMEFEDLLQKLPDAEPRYVLFDIPIKNRANLDDLRTVFIMYMPMESPVRMRMMYSSTKSVIMSNFRGLSTSVQAEEKEQLSIEYLQNKVQRTQGINNP